MEDFKEHKCLVVGAGEMGQAHISALLGLDVGAVAAYAPSTRNEEAVKALGAAFYSGSFEGALEQFSPTHAVVAAPVQRLADESITLMEAGVKSLLIEKPAALTRAEGERLAAAAKQHGTHIMVGYNRRYYGAVRKALAMIEESGEPVTSVVFEFTEWSDVISQLTNQSDETKARWVLANSMHVIDSAFIPIAFPDEAKSSFMTAGKLDWHSVAQFVGSGLTTDNVPFSYCANWDAPGRWGFEWLTPSTRYIFRPMEKLHITKRGSVAVEEVPLDDDLDERFKPGLYHQNKAWLLGEADGRQCGLDEALYLIDLAGKIGGYADGETA